MFTNNHRAKYPAIVYAGRAGARPLSCRLPPHTNPNHIHGTCFQDETLPSCPLVK